MFSGRHFFRLEHDAEKCERFSGDIMLHLFYLETDFRFQVDFDPKSSGS